MSKLNSVQSLDEEQKVGYKGFQVDPTPRKNYTVAGVLDEAPTPETDKDAFAAAQTARNTRQGDLPTHLTEGAKTPDVYEDLVPAANAGEDKQKKIGTVYNTGTVTSVTFEPDTDVTGADTNSRTFLLKKGGSSGTTIATLNLNAAAGTIAEGQKKAFTINSASVTEDDVLTVFSNHVGTGLAVPVGEVVVKVTAA